MATDATVHTSQAAEQECLAKARGCVDDESESEGETVVAYSQGVENASVADDSIGRKIVEALFTRVFLALKPCFEVVHAFELPACGEVRPATEIA